MKNRQFAVWCFAALLFAMALSTHDVGWITIAGLFFFLWSVLTWYWYRWMSALVLFVLDTIAWCQGLFTRHE